jgi:hypothetical protein
LKGQQGNRNVQDNLTCIHIDEMIDTAQPRLDIHSVRHRNAIRMISHDAIKKLDTQSIN